MAGAERGRLRFSPVSDSPGVTVSRLVPSASICAINCARLELEIPSTLTIVAMPRAIPEAERIARAGLLAMPSAATAATSRTRNRVALLPARLMPLPRCPGQKTLQNAVQVPEPDIRKDNVVPL